MTWPIPEKVTNQKLDFYPWSPDKVYKAQFPRLRVLVDEVKKGRT